MFLSHKLWIYCDTNYIHKLHLEIGLESKYTQSERTI